MGQTQTHHESLSFATFYVTEPKPIDHLTRLIIRSICGTEEKRFGPWYFNEKEKDLKIKVLQSQDSFIAIGRKKVHFAFFHWDEYITLISEPDKTVIEANGKILIATSRPSHNHTNNWYIYSLYYVKDLAKKIKSPSLHQLTVLPRSQPIYLTDSGDVIHFSIREPGPRLTSFNVINRAFREKSVEPPVGYTFNNHHNYYQLLKSDGKNLFILIKVVDFSGRFQICLLKINTDDLKYAHKVIDSKDPFVNYNISEESDLNNLVFTVGYNSEIGSPYKNYQVLLFKDLEVIDELNFTTSRLNQVPYLNLIKRLFSINPDYFKSNSVPANLNSIFSFFENLTKDSNMIQVFPTRHHFPDGPLPKELKLLIDSYLTFG